MAEKQFLSVLGGKIGDDTFDCYLAVDGAEAALGGDGLGKGFEGVGFIKQGLALKIGRLDEIAINNSEMADTRADQKICGGRAQCSATDQDYSGGQETPLSMFADSGEEDLARVTVLQVRVHRVPDTHYSAVVGNEITGMP